MTFKEVLTQKREQKEVSVYKLSAMSGVPKSTIFSYERGVTPTLDKADKLLKALGVSLVIGAVESHED